MNFEDLLHKKLNGKYDYLKVLKVVYDTTFSLALVNFIYPESVKTLTEEQKNEIRQAVSEILNLNTKLECKFNKSFLDENLVINKVKDFFKENFESIDSCIDKGSIIYKRDNIFIEITIKLNSTLYDYFKENDISEKLKKYLKDNFCGDFIVGSEIDNSDDFDEEELDKRAFEIQSKLEVQAKTPRYKVGNVLEVFGGEIMPMPEYIKNLEGEKVALILAGTVKDLEEKEFLPRRNKAKGSDEKRKMYKFKLDDGTGIVNCVHFCSKKSEKHFGLVEEGKTIICLGNYLKRDMGGMQYLIKSISLCTILNEEQEEEIITTSAEIYKYTKPIPYVQITQDNFLIEQVTYPDYIMNNKFVVFDLETTGLNAETDEITEFGAVKIEKGLITEKFQILCKPSVHIPEKITQITGIDDAMVADKEPAEKVIEDFFIFTKGCILVGYNVNFDHQFIQATAKRIGRYFDNEVHDCMKDAKDKLYLSNYKLGTVVASLGITLDNAHRALYDATATAEAFLKLSVIKNMTNS